MLTAAAYHKSSNILQKHQGYFLLVAVHNEACGFICRITVDYPTKLHFGCATGFLAFNNFTVIGHNTYSPSINTGIATDNGFTIIFLVGFKLTVVNQAVNNIYGFIGFCSVGGQNTQNLCSAFSGQFWFYAAKTCFFVAANFIHDKADMIQAAFVIRVFIVNNPTNFALRGGTS